MGKDNNFEMQDYLINWNAGPLGLVLRPELGADMPPVVTQVLPEQSVAKLSGVRVGDLLISVDGKKTTKLGYERVVRLLFKEKLPIVLHFRMPRANVAAEEPLRRVPSGDHRERGENQTSVSIVSSAYSNGSGGTIHPPPPPTTPKTPSIDPQLSQEDNKLQLKGKVQRKRNGGHPSGRSEQRRLRKQYSVIWENGSLGISFRPYNARVNVPCVEYIGVRGGGRDMERVCINDVLIAINGEKTKTLGVEKVLRWLHVIEKPVVLRFHSSSNRIEAPSPSIRGLQPELEPRPLRRHNPTFSGDFTHEEQPQRRYTNMSMPRGQDIRRVDEETPQRRYSNDEVVVDYESMRRPETRRGVSHEYPPHQQRQYANERMPPPREQYDADQRPHVMQRRYSNHSMHSNHSYHAMDPRDDPSYEADHRREPDGWEPEFRREPERRYTNNRMPQEVDFRELEVRYANNRVPQEADFRGPERRYTNNRLPQESEFLEQENHFANVRIHQQEFHEKVHAHLEMQRRLSNHSQAHSQVRSERVGMSDLIRPDEVDQLTLDRVSRPSTKQELTFDEAVGIVARASGKSVEECEFGGVPLLNIQEGTVQARLMFVFAKTCLAKEKETQQSNKSTTEPTSSRSAPSSTKTDLQDANHQPPPQSPAQPASGATRFGRPESKLVSYSFAQENQERTRSASSDSFVLQTPAENGKATISEGKVLFQNNEPNLVTQEALVATKDEFISLKDFVIEGDGKLTERPTVSSLNSSVTPVPSANDEDDHIAIGNNLVALQHQPGNTETQSVRDQASDTNPLGSEKSDTSAKLHILQDSVADMILIGEQPIHSIEENVDDNKETTTDEPSPVQNQQTTPQEDSGDSLANPAVANLYAAIPDVCQIVKDKSVDSILVKKQMIDEIQDILHSLQMESQFERHSHIGMGTMPRMVYNDIGPSPPNGKCCFQCGKTGDLADLAIGNGRKEWYCQDCWEIFFFSEDRLSPRSNAALAPSEVGDDGTEDEALKYSFHDSMASRDDMILPWRNLQSMDSRLSMRDSSVTTGSSISEHTDEVWL